MQIQAKLLHFYEQGKSETETDTVNCLESQGGKSSVVSNLNQLQNITTQEVWLVLVL